MRNPIISARDFFDSVVDLDCLEAMRNPDDVRATFHACASLHHLKEWVFNSGLVGLDYAAFTAAVNAKCPDLNEVRKIAINAKHPDPGSVPKMDVGVSAAPMPFGSGAYGAGMFGVSPMQDQVIAKAVTGTDVWAQSVIRSAHFFWKQELTNIGL